MKKYMVQALAEAKIAYGLGEVPIGAVVVKDGTIIGRGHNLIETTGDPTAHGEMIAIRRAAKNIGGWRLNGCQLYVTVEPCPMCAGAILNSRIDSLYIGTEDLKKGACKSLFNIVADERLNHQVQVHWGIMQEDCREIMKSFFIELRKRGKRW